MELNRQKWRPTTALNKAKIIEFGLEDAKPGTLQSATLAVIALYWHIQAGYCVRKCVRPDSARTVAMGGGHVNLWCVQKREKLPNYVIGRDKAEFA